MMLLTKSALVPGLVAAAVVAISATVLAEEPNGPFENIKFSPVTVAWQYSNDGGQTFSDKPHPAPPPGPDPRSAGGKSYPFVWKGTFELADPAKTAGLWVRMFEEHTGGNAPRASICNGDLVAASGGYWKDLGFCPTLLDAAITLNGKEVPIAHGPIVQFWVPLIGEFQKGENTVELRGNVYTYWGGAAYTGKANGPVMALDARVISAEPQPCEIFNGPLLGDFGDGYFTLACRTQLPAELTVEAKPVEANSAEPAGAAVTAVSKLGIWHRVKVEVPKGTRQISYTLSAKVGPHVTKRGPFTLTLPGKQYRFAAFGHALQQPGNDEPWGANSKQVHKAQPSFVVNTGNLMEQESWSFQWDKAYAGPAAELLASVPTLTTPCNHDFTGIFNELHYTPAADGYSHNWTKVVGPVRFIGIDGNQDWPAGGENAKWLEEVLKAAKEKYIIVLAGYPGYTSGINSKRFFPVHLQARDVVLPLLGKYNATLMLSSWDPTYERIEPTPDKGVTQIVTGCIGKGAWHKWDSRFGMHHAFGPGPTANPRGTQGKVTLPDGREWVGYFSTRHFCLFDVSEEAIEMKVLACAGSPDVDTKDLKVIDQKTFKPRK
ncbi:MAG: hypothetical protein K8T25_19760 [Planctomycetia bacterium]|nr:hypothetical protein [Planctomycetia bacterium]